MVSTNATTPAGLNIATAVNEVACGFTVLANALTPNSRFKVTPASIQDELCRFKLWAGNIAAHRTGSRSLEYRLRDADHLKEETHNLLRALKRALHSALEIATDKRVPWDELEYSDSDSDSELSEDSISNGLQSITELEQLMKSIKTAITSLFRLSMAIRSPAPNNQSRSYITADKSMYEHYDVEHVRFKFPDCPQYLADRLGRAMTARRQYLSQREEHHQKLAKNIERIGSDNATTEFTANSTEATPLPNIVRVHSLDVLDADADMASQTSYATSVNATIRMPPLPKEAYTNESFECPLCFFLISIHNTKAWRQHVYRDLYPYSCTYKSCTSPDRLYDSCKAWFAHELEAHRTIWQCVEGCDKTFKVEPDFEIHVQRSHPDLASASMLLALKRTSARRARLSEQTECALCRKPLQLRALQRHMGNHQQQLALFALPTEVQDTEDESDFEDNDFSQVANHNSEELSDMSDTLGTEQAVEDCSILPEPKQDLSFESTTEEADREVIQGFSKGRTTDKEDLCFDTAVDEDLRTPNAEHAGLAEWLETQNDLTQSPPGFSGPTPWPAYDKSDDEVRPVHVEEKTVQLENKDNAGPVKQKSAITGEQSEIPHEAAVNEQQRQTMEHKDGVNASSSMAHRPRESLARDTTRGDLVPGYHRSESDTSWLSRIKLSEEEMLERFEVPPEIRKKYERFPIDRENEADGRRYGDYPWSS